MSVGQVVTTEPAIELASAAESDSGSLFALWPRWGAQTLQIVVEAGNGAARRFYRTYGFSAVGPELFERVLPRCAEEAWGPFSPGRVLTGGARR